MTLQEASEELKEEFEVFKDGIDPKHWENPNKELKKIIEANTIVIKLLEQLSKGHGRLIILSEEAVKREQTPLTLNFSCQKWISEVGLSNATVAIIDVESEEEE